MLILEFVRFGSQNLKISNYMYNRLLTNWKFDRHAHKINITQLYNESVIPKDEYTLKCSNITQI